MLHSMNSGPLKHSLGLARFALMQSAEIRCGPFLVASFVGDCGGQQKWHLMEVKGTVTRNNRAVAGIGVVFWPDVESGTQGLRASGVTDAHGRYELQTDVRKLGAAAGKYRVCITDSRDLTGSKESDWKCRIESRRINANGNPAAEARETAEDSSAADATDFPKEYGKFDKTPLRAEVKADSGQKIDFKIP